MKNIEFLRDYFNEDENFIIAQRYPMIDGKVKHHHTMLNIKNKNLNKHLGRFYYMNKDRDVDIYFSLNSYKAQKTFYPSRKEEFVESIKSFYFDIDKGDIEQKKADIINLLGHPTYIIESSKDKFQFIYKFTEPKIVKSEYDRSEFKKLLKGLCYHFDIDKTFDTARIFRLADYMNKKPQNNNYKVTIQKYEYYYNYQEFEELAKNYTLQEKELKKASKSDVKPRQKTAQTKPSTISSSESKFDKYRGVKKIINRKYKELLNKYNQDKSTTDLAFAKWLRYSKQITEEDVITEKIFKARGYKELMEKHGYQIEYYIDNILEKSL